jgi:hypothetical protein
MIVMIDSLIWVRFKHIVRARCDSVALNAVLEMSKLLLLIYVFFVLTYIHTLDTVFHRPNKNTH